MLEDGKTIFLISFLTPFPPSRGVELRIYRLLRWLTAQEYRVVLVLSADSIEENALRELRAVTYAVHWQSPALRTRIGARFPTARRLIWGGLKRLISRHGAMMNDTENQDMPAGSMQGNRSFVSPEFVALVGNLARRYRPMAAIAEYIFSTPVFSTLPVDTLKIVDTIDVFSRKKDQVLAFGIVDPLACSEAEERSALLTADVIIAIQSEEAILLKALVPEREVVLAGMDFDVAPDASRPPVPNTIAVVASDNAMNVHGLTAFLSDCWPTIKASCPGVLLHIVGRVGDRCVVVDPQIRYRGWVDDLDEVYREASVVINPTIAGTGLKIKSVQALAHGKPLVAWSNGVEGLDYSGEPPFRECHSWPEFATVVTRLLHSDQERASLETRALSYAKTEFAASKVYAALGSRLAAAADRAKPTPRRTASDQRSATTIV